MTKKKTAKKKTTKKTPKTSFMDDSPWARLQNEVQQSSECRQRLLKEIEAHFGCTVVSFFKAFNKSNSLILDSDAEMLESILAVEQEEQDRLLLIINSPGGDALAAERIVNVCRAYSGDQFEVLVPHMAKSAATMICFGADQIHLTRTGELGPVDPQVAYTDDNGNTLVISAEEYVRSYDELMAQASSGNNPRIEPFIQQLNRYDSRYIEQLRSAQKLSADISVRLLESGMLKGKNADEIRQSIDVFLQQEKTSSHGRMINHTGIAKCGLKVKLIPFRTPVWKLIWELFIRSDWYVTQRCNGIIESPRVSLVAK